MLQQDSFLLFRTGSLQVLISIQSMILGTPDPFFNEVRPTPQQLLFAWCLLAVCVVLRHGCFGGPVAAGRPRWSCP